MLAPQTGTPPRAPHLITILSGSSMKRFWTITLLALATACSPVGERGRIDSARVAAADRQRLSNELAAQKDSLTSAVLEADDFISQIDSQISRVKGLSRSKRKKAVLESPLEQQVQARKEMLARVKALVDRTQETASQLAEAKRRERALRGENEQLLSQVEKDQELINALGATIQRKTAMIARLEASADSIMTELRTAEARYSKAYYVIGTKDELMKKGVIVQEGGANLLIVHPGRVLTPARKLDREVFTAVDSRDVREIAVPDTTRKYTVVSRQSLDFADVAARDKATFRGSSLKIANVEQFWAPSRYLIIVEQ
jgi:hypothetical protein